MRKQFLPFSDEKLHDVVDRIPDKISFSVLKTATNATGALMEQPDMEIGRAVKIALNSVGASKAIYEQEIRALFRERRDYVRAYAEAHGKNADQLLSELAA